MKRKLVKQGVATLMISLPSKWLKDYSLVKGDNVDLNVFNDYLLISPDKVNKKNEVSIKLQGLTETSIRTLITNTYRKGFDKIRVNFTDNAQFKILDKIIRTNFIGFDIIKREKDSCLVESITEPSEEQFENILDKIFLNIFALFELTKKRLHGEKPEEDYEDIEERIMKYDNFCRRIISKQKFLEEKAEFLWAFMHLMDHAQREIYHLNRNLSNVKVSPQTKTLCDETEKMFEIIRDSYLKKDLSILNKAHDLDKKAFYKDGYFLLGKTSGKETIVVYHLMASLRLFFLTNSPLTGLIL